MAIADPSQPWPGYADIVVRQEMRRFNMIVELSNKNCIAACILSRACSLYMSGLLALLHVSISSKSKIEHPQTCLVANTL